MKLRDRVPKASGTGPHRETPPELVFRRMQPFLRHIGVYAFRPAALRAFCALPRGVLEVRESLEQLRWLEAGRRIRVLAAAEGSVGIDTPEHYAQFLARERARTVPETGSAAPHARSKA